MAQTAKSTNDDVVVDTGEVTDEITTDVVPHVDNAALIGIESWEDAISLANELGTLVDATDVLGNGFEILDTKDKGQLVGVPMLFLSWRFNDGDNGEFVSALVVLKVGNGIRKVVLNDGSTGIKEQLKSFTFDYAPKKLGGQKFSGLVAKNGLRRSDYTIEIDGKESAATTFYIA
jgi:hypothetical protein